MENILFPLWYKCMAMTKEKEEEKVRKIKIGSVPFLGRRILHHSRTPPSSFGNRKENIRPALDFHFLLLSRRSYIFRTKEKTKSSAFLYTLHIASRITAGITARLPWQRTYASATLAIRQEALVDTEYPIHLVSLAPSRKEPSVVRTIYGKHGRLQSFAQSMQTLSLGRTAAAGPCPDSRDDPSRCSPPMAGDKLCCAALAPLHVAVVNCAAL